MDTPKRHSDVLEETGSRVNESISAVREAAQEKFEQGKAKAREMTKSFEAKVREQPLKSVLVALGIGAGVGIVVGYLLRRR